MKTALALSSFALILALSATYIARADSAPDQTAAGFWAQTDDEGHVGAWFYFTKVKGVYEGRMVKMFKRKPDDPDFITCTKCTGDQKDAPMLGLTLVKGMKRDGRKYEDGTILDPRDGSVYSAEMEVSDDGQKLSVRGYLGISLFGQTQVWNRLPDDSIAPCEIPPDSVGPTAHSTPAHPKDCATPPVARAKDATTPSPTEAADSATPLPSPSPSHAKDSTPLAAAHADEAPDSATPSPSPSHAKRPKDAATPSPSNAEAYTVSAAPSPSPTHAKHAKASASPSSSTAEEATGSGTPSPSPSHTKHTKASASPSSSTAEEATESGTPSPLPTHAKRRPKASATASPTTAEEPTDAAAPSPTPSPHPKKHAKVHSSPSPTQSDAPSPSPSAD